jgi:acyl-CoA synthetase (AMP-forming)/AMP-acid ligase II
VWARAISGLEFSTGDRLGFVGANSLAHLEGWSGVPASGLVLVDLNFRLFEDALVFMIDDGELSVLMCSECRIPAGGRRFTRSSPSRREPGCRRRS